MTDLFNQYRQNSEISYWCGNPAVQIHHGTIYHYTTEKTKSTLLQTFGSDITLLAPFIPCHISPAEFVQFIKHQVNSTASILLKVLHGSKPSVYPSLIFCPSKQYALLLLQKVHNQPYNPVEDITCQLHLVIGLTIEEDHLPYPESFERSDSFCTLNQSDQPYDHPHYHYEESKELCDLETFSDQLNQQLYIIQQSINNQLISSTPHDEATCDIRRTYSVPDGLYVKGSPEGSSDTEEDYMPLLLSPRYLLEQLLSEETSLTCAVCLEKLSLEYITSENNVSNEDCRNDIIHLLCGHCFHSNCLLKWYDATCPCCRYQQYPLKVSCCTLCGVSANLMTCLICGSIGCSNDQTEYSKENVESNLDTKEVTRNHALQHYYDTGHVYAMHIMSQRVWDFASRTFISRLYQNHEDGKICSQVQESESDLKQSKKFELEDEFQCVLQAQLDSLREYFESKETELYTGFRECYQSIVKQSDATQLVLDSVTGNHQQLTARLTKLREEIRELSGTKEQLKEKVKQLENEREHLQQQLNVQRCSTTEYVEHLKQTLNAKQNELKDLKKEAEDLWFHIKATDTISGVQLKSVTIVVKELANSLRGGHRRCMR